MADLRAYRRAHEPASTVASPVPPSVYRGPAVRLPTAHGPGQLIAYTAAAAPGREPNLALVFGDLAASAEAEAAPLVRLHSECLTGDVFGSQRCECGAQLAAALALIAAAGGVLLYLRQEGRGIGLRAKLRAYALQERGLDTVEANECLGLPVDAREYATAAAILRDLGVTRLRLLTNNPAKVAGLAAAGLTVVERLPLIVNPSPENRRYLTTKRERLGHLVDAPSGAG